MKVHIIGTAGSGKTTLGAWISGRFDVPSHDLDWIVYDRAGERPESEIGARIDGIRRESGWVTEGAYHEPWLLPLLDDADRIVWLDVSLVVCVVRMVKRHLLAELRRNNAHPGWRRLARFLRYTVRTDREQRAATRNLLAPYAGKVARCTTSCDTDRLRAALSARSSSS